MLMFYLLLNSVLSAGTKVEQRNEADVTTSSPNIGNTYVGSCVFYSAVLLRWWLMFYCWCFVLAALWQGCSRFLPWQCAANADSYSSSPKLRIEDVSNWFLFVYTLLPSKWVMFPSKWIVCPSGWVVSPSVWIEFSTCRIKSASEWILLPSSQVKFPSKSLCLAKIFLKIFCQRQ